MSFNFTFQSDLNPVTIYSAVVSTAVALWQVYVRFTDGPRLRVKVRGNQILAGGGHIDPKTYISVSAANVGNRATTIEVVGVYTYSNWWKRFRRKHDSLAYIVNISGPPGHSIPHLLEPGRTFMGLAIQTEDMAKLSRDKLTYFTISHSMAKRDRLVRLRPIEDEKKPED